MTAGLQSDDAVPAGLRTNPPLLHASPCIIPSRQIQKDATREPRPPLTSPAWPANRSRAIFKLPISFASVDRSHERPTFSERGSDFWWRRDQRGANVTKSNRARIVRMAITYLSPRGVEKSRLGRSNSAISSVGTFEETWVKSQYRSASTTGPLESSGNPSAATVLLTWTDTERYRRKPMFHYSHARGLWLECKCRRKLIPHSYQHLQGSAFAKNFSS